MPIYDNLGVVLFAPLLGKVFKPHIIVRVGVLGQADFEFLVARMSTVWKNNIGTHSGCQGPRSSGLKKIAPANTFKVILECHRVPLTNGFLEFQFLTLTKLYKPERSKSVQPRGQENER